ncbi:hypothetical protein GCM10010470_46540 [Saccharopolyspora taberi]|uniref:SPW repeat-containing integral membrane domain-containing protein n=2 Tax=Saccharopolyspora taberi TaxID=60895 RepID=A0ABN3VJ07_9PSEU
MRHTAAERTMGVAVLPGEVAVMVKQWTRWQDWLVVAVGVLAVLSPLWAAASAAATASLIVLGVLLTASAIWSLVKPGSLTSEWVHMALGALLVISPWIVGYSAEPASAGSAWVLGALAVILGAAALPSATTAHHGRGMAGQH